MTRLHQGSITLPASLPQAENPLPVFRWQQPMPHQPVPAVGLSDEEMAGYTHWGDLSILPYRIQDSYSRELQETKVDCITLENELIRVVILPSLGGRVRSMLDKATGRELLFCNPVIRSGNLALRNAWFSGGIEWNGGGIPGHAASTCEPVFCHQVDTEKGCVLRIHDFDRGTETAWQVDLYLPKDEARLFVHGRIVNPNEDARNVYWWTNASVAHQKGQRIVAPADYVIEHALPDNHLESYDFPDQWGFDGSFPGNWQSSTSVFFRKSGQMYPWLTACNADGTGLGQMSTASLLGRKFFYFGFGDGGRHWMEFLSTSEHGGDYVEVQAGLIPTQNQTFSLAPGKAAEWTECYFPVEDVSEVTKVDYARAETLANQAVAKQLSSAELDEVDAFLTEVAQFAPSRQLSSGSQWGQLHETMSGKPISGGMSFEQDHVTQNAWAALAEGRLPDEATAQSERDFAVSDLWEKKLEAVADRTGWFSTLHLGIIELDREAFGPAETYLKTSWDARPTWLSARCLAVLHERLKRYDEAVSWYKLALDQPEVPCEVELECAQLLSCSGRKEELRRVMAGLSPTALKMERCRILRAELALQLGNMDQLEDLLDYDFAAIREGEIILSELWQGLVHGQAADRLGRQLTAEERTAALADRPIPFNLDFVMLREERIKGGTRAVG